MTYSYSTTTTGQENIIGLLYSQQAINLANKEAHRYQTRELGIDNYSSQVGEILDTGADDFYARNGILTDKGIATIEDTVECNSQVIACMKLLKKSVTRLNIKPVPANTSEEAKILADYWTYNFANMEGTINKALYEIFSGIIYGYALSEKIYKYAPSGQFEGKLVVDKIKNKKPGSWEFILDSYGNIKAVNNLVNYKLIGKNKFMIYTYDTQFSDPYGRGIAKTLYYLCYGIQELTKQMLIGAGTWAEPSVMVKLPGLSDSKTEADAAKAFVNSIRNTSGGILPQGFEAGLLQAASGSNPFIEIFHYFLAEIAKTIIGNAGTTNESQKFGSYAKAKIEATVTEVNVSALIQDAKELLKEQLIRPLTYHNFDPIRFPVEIYPEIEISAENEDDKNGQMDRAIKAVEIGAARMYKKEDRKKVRAIDGWIDETDEEIDEMLLDLAEDRKHFESID